nr:putative ribonuclease H-like domain-containing protein [Tanacetum cinerariifolium]
MKTILIKLGSGVNTKIYCSPIGNISYITDFKEFNGGYVAFGGGAKGATKNETSRILKSFITEIEILVDKKVKIIKCDNETKFKNRVMNKFCKEKGIKREYNVARTPQQNRIAKRRNRTLIKAARTMLADSKLPITFWADAINTACYVQNRTIWDNLMENQMKGSLLATLQLVKLLEYTTLELGSTKDVNTIRPSINTASSNINIASPTVNTAKQSDDFFGDDNDMRSLDEVEVDISNISTIYPVLTTLNTRIHKDHSLDNVIGDIDKRAIGTKWVFSNKKDKRVIVIRNKDKLVAQGCTQEEGIDYDEVFAPVVGIEAIILFLTYVSFMGFLIYQMDVKSANLYERIKEEVYVCQPLGFGDPDYPDKVYKVEKALYGLYQALSAWYETLSKYLLGNGFNRGKIDQTLFIKRQKGDILLVQVRTHLLLRVENVKTTSTLMDKKKALLKDSDGDDVDVHLYRSMIGSLMYLTSSRPDIMFAVYTCAKFQVTPKVSHLHAVKRIFRHLKGKPKLSLWYPRDSPFDLVAYTDSDYAGASLDRKSTSKGCQFLRYRLISWQCKKQTMVATSTTEAKYVAADGCCGQVLWIHNQLLDYRLAFIGEAQQTWLSLILGKKMIKYEALKWIRHVIVCLLETELILSDNLSTARQKVNNASVNLILLAFLKKPQGSEDFHQMVDFLHASHIRYALTKNPTIYVSLINQLWCTASARTLDNGEMELNATVDGQDKTITKASVKRHIKLADADGIITLPTTKIFEHLALMGNTRTKTRRMGIRIPQSNVSSSVADEVITKDMHDGLGRATTTASILEVERWSRVPRYHGGSPVQARPKWLSNLPNEPLLGEGNTSRSGEGSMQLLELMDICTKLAFIESLKDEEASLDHEDSPKQVRMIEEIDEDENVNLVQSSKAIMQESEPSKKIKKKEMIQISLDEEIAQRMLEEEKESLSIKERSRLLIEFIDKIKKMLAGKRAEEKRNKPPTQAQQRTYMSKYIKNIGGYTLKQLKQYSFEEIKMLFDNTMESIRKFVPMERAVGYYKIYKADGSYKTYIFFSEMLNDFDREDLIVLYRLFNEKYATIRLGFDDLMLWGDMKIMFEPDGDDAVWKNHHSQELIEWKLYDSCGVYSLMLEEVSIQLLVEKKYPLPHDTLTRMLQWKLHVNYNVTEMAYELLSEENEEDDDDEDETKTTYKVEGDEDEEMDFITSQLYDDVDIRLNELVDTIKRFVQEEGTDAALTKSDAEIVSPLDIHVHQEVAVTLIEFELKKIFIDKKDKIESYLAALEHRECYEGLKKSYDLDKSFLSTYGKVYSLKRSQKDNDRDEDPFVGSDQGLKKRKTSKYTELAKGPKAKESQSSSSKGDKSKSKSSGNFVPNGKMIVDSIKNGPYIRRIIATPGEPDLPVPVPESFHEQTHEELTETDIKRMDADDQPIQTIILGLPEDVYATVDSCETAKEIWERVL